MRYIFMDNYRGFAETIVPLRDATFLVGENSTGKSSFLAAVNLLSTQQFVLSPYHFPRGTLPFLGGFSDIVSITSADRSYFSIGALLTGGSLVAAGKGGIECEFLILKFCDEEGQPRLNTYIHYVNGKLGVLRFKGDEALYRFTRQSPSAADARSVLDFLLRVYRHSFEGDSAFKALPKELPRGLPPTLMLQMLESVGSDESMGVPIRSMEIPGFGFPAVMGFSRAEWSWFAPIRTQPQRIYEGFKTDFTPAGDHTPYLIKSSLSSAETAKEFAQLLDHFGESSGLFSSVTAHSFGRDPSAPFEVMVQLHGTPLNISNVGYGVSQVLPVVVEMITRPRGHGFAIQQPEVHLHPRAQAALGNLLHFLVVEHGHRYLVETHSDYMIDRFRLRVKETGRPKEAQVVFFWRTSSGNKAQVLRINDKGQYPREQPDEFRRFFINEELRLLEI
jgi:hypothetical protein